MPTTKELGLYTAPDYITNYIIKYKHPLGDVMDFARLLIRISFVNKVVFAFAEDLWPEVYECVKDLLEVKRRYITACQYQIATNPAGRPDGERFKVAQQTINETIAYCTARRVAEERYAPTGGDNGPPPPYEPMAR